MLNYIKVFTLKCAAKDQLLETFGQLKAKLFKVPLGIYWHFQVIKYLYKICLDVAMEVNDTSAPHSIISENFSLGITYE